LHEQQQDVQQQQLADMTDSCSSWLPQFLMPAMYAICKTFAFSQPGVRVSQDTVPAENSVISMLMKANNKATGTPFNHM
jgi:hypothetical protein